MDDIKHLENWVSIAEAAEILGVTPQAVHQMCSDGVFKPLDIRSIGARKPTFLLWEEKVLNVKSDRDDAATARAEKAAVKDRDKALRRAANKPQLEFMVDSESGNTNS